MEISLTNYLTFDEYHTGARLARTHVTGRSAQLHHLALAKSGFIVLFVALLLLLATCFIWRLRFDISQIFLLGTTALLLSLFYLPFMERQWDRRIYKDGKLGAPVQMKLLNEHLSVALEDATEVRIPWTLFSYIENESFFILIAPTRLIVIPKRLLALDGLDHIRNIVPLSKGHSTC